MMVKNESSDYLDSFEAVFLGTIVDVERKGDTTLSATFRMTVDVSRWWKGEPDDSVVIETDFGICNAALLAGQSYVFFAERTLDGEYGPRVNWAVLAGAPDLPELLDAALQSP